MSPPRSRTPPAGAARWLTAGAVAFGAWGLSVLCLLLLFPILLLADAAGGRRRIRAFVTGFLRAFFLGLLPAVRFYRLGEIPDPEIARAAGPRLLAANHRSRLDALLALALFPGVRIPAKASYLEAPLFGRVMRWLDCIPVDAASRDSLRAAAEAGRRVLASGGSLLVFPEGTRSPDGRLMAFGDLFFRAAVDEGAPVVPVVIHSEEPFLSPQGGRVLHRRPNVWTVRLLSRLSPDPGERAGDLAHRARAGIAEALSSLEGGADSRRRG